MARKPMQPTHTRAREPRVEDVRLHGFTHGGEAVGRMADGKAVFVPLAIPGERVRVRVVDERARWARGELVEVLEASPDRVQPACELFGTCGGCALQHIAPERRLALLRQVLVDQLERIGGLVDPPVAPIRQAGEWGYRNTARFALDSGNRLGYRVARSHRVVPVASCPLVHPRVQALRVEVGETYTLPAPEVREVVIRAATQGEGATLITLPGDSGGTITERVAGLDFRVSPGSFFQQNTAGAEILLELVREAAQARPGDRALDLYAGVGLFARGLAKDGAEVIAVEAGTSAVEDARENLADLPAEIWHGSAEEALDELDGSVDVVVLDPPRAGAGNAVTAALAALGARVIVYVSCDPASLARDARTLAENGYRLELATPVDQFAQTAHLETVAVFRPAVSSGFADSGA